MAKPVLKIAIIGEGRNDVGIMGAYEWQDGTIQSYLKRFFEDEFELEFYPLAVSKTETRSLIGLKGGRYRKYKIRGVAKKLFRFVTLHKNNTDFDLLIFFSDTDKTQGRKASEIEAKQKYANLLNDIHQGKQLINDEMPSLHFIPMVPIRILECWLLGDEEGFEYMGCSPQKPSLPVKPELIWGDQNNPDSDYPKYYLKRILDNEGFENTTSTYQTIVMNNNLYNLVKNCPLSFAPFAKNIATFKNGLLK